MEDTKDTLTRIQARNAAMQVLNRLTAAVAFVAVAGVGLLGAVSAHTIPGVSPSSSASAASASASTSSTSASVSASTGVSSSSSSAVAVSGGS